MLGNLIFFGVAMVVCILFVFGVLPLSMGSESMSLREQLEKGVPPNDIICKPSFVLVMRTSGDPACFTPLTVSKLMERNYLQEVVKEFVPSESKNVSEKPSNNGSGSTITGHTGQTKSYVENIPASPGSIVNFYISDPDLNTSPNGVDIVKTQGLLEFTVNGVAVEGPETMIETGPSTGKFYVKLQLPDSITGRIPSQDDIIGIKYIDETGAGGEKRIITQSIPLAKTFAQMETSGTGKTRIGHDFTVRIYEPDANLDSRNVDRISLSAFEYRGEGGIRTTLTNPVFAANSPFLYETGENTGVFEVTIKIPRTISGKPVHIGHWYEITYIDKTTPANTDEKVKLKGKIG